MVIAALAEETFHARLLLEQDGRTVEIDARPSDALALAVRRRRPDLRGGGGSRPGRTRRRRDRGRPRVGVDAEALESTGERIADPRLDVFREFVNSLDAEGEQREGPGPSSS